MIPRQLLTLTASSGYAQLIEYKIIALETEKRPLAERVMEKLKLVAKTFLLSAILFAVLTAALKIAHWLSRLGELHVKASYVLTLLAGQPG